VDLVLVTKDNDKLASLLRKELAAKGNAHYHISTSS